MLRSMLVPTTGGESRDGYEDQLSSLTSGLLSTLADRGASLEALFQLYRQILVPRERRKKYVFERKLGLLLCLSYAQTLLIDVHHNKQPVGGGHGSGDAVTS
jgi:hypothetical protein